MDKVTNSMNGAPEVLNNDVVATNIQKFSIEDKEVLEKIATIVAQQLPRV
jgi:hypothetical protein